MSDNVNHPHHYEGSTSLECIEAMTIAFGEQGVCYFCLCNAFKYMWRYKNKNGLEDLKKADWYLNYSLDLIQRIPDFQAQELLTMYNRCSSLYDSIIKRLPKEDVEEVTVDLGSCSYGVLL